MLKKYKDENGNVIEEDDGWLFVNGSCVQQPGTDADFDRYAIEVQNGDGYYASDGHFVWYRDDDWSYEL